MWFFRRKPDPPALKKRVEVLELALDALQFDHQRSQAQLQKLSGVVYRRLQLKEVGEEGSDDSKRLTSDQILAKAGFVPGRPMPKVRNPDHD